MKTLIIGFKLDTTPKGYIEDFNALVVVADACEEAYDYSLSDSITEEALSQALTQGDTFRDSIVDVLLLDVKKGEIS